MIPQLPARVVRVKHGVSSPRYRLFLKVPASISLTTGVKIKASVGAEAGIVPLKQRVYQQPIAHPRRIDTRSDYGKERLL